MTTNTPGTEPMVIALPLDGLTISALTWGPTDGPLALCLHGYPDTAHTWRHLGPHLADLGYRVVAPFARGYAPTEIPADRDYHVGALMADAVAIHAALAGDSRAVLIGHDWGAITAMGLGANADSPFRAIVSMSVPPMAALIRPRPHPIRWIALIARQLVMSWYIFFQQVPAVPERVFDRLVARLWMRWSPGFDATEDLRHVMTALGARENRTAALGYYRHVIRPLRRSSPYRRWQDTWMSLPIVPMLYLHGDADGCLQQGFAERVVPLLGPGSEVIVIPGAGHFLQLEKPSQVNEAISAFVGGP